MILNLLSQRLSQWAAKSARSPIESSGIMASLGGMKELFK
jgi:hypothetical protein